MLTAGIDLATRPRKTAVCVVNWSGSEAAVRFETDCTDDGLVAVCRTYDKVGIDCPFGWPLPFIAAIGAHAHHEPFPGPEERSEAFWVDPASRRTDRVVRETTGIVPLRVAADRIGLTALRCARLLDALGTVDRTGRAGRVAEVYPAASLQAWKMPHRGLKKAHGREQRERVLNRFAQEMPLTWQSGAWEKCLSSDDSFDAFICAITARAVATRGTQLPEPGEQAERAAAEGWIHLPTVAPGELTSPRTDHSG